MVLVPQEYKIRAKLDRLLIQVLDTCDEGDRLLVIIVLADTEIDNNHIKPWNFSSRAEYRQALVEHRKQQLAAGIVGATIRQLKKLSLVICGGGKASRFLIAEGLAENILQAVYIPGVKLICLDQDIHIEKEEEDVFTGVQN